MGDFLYPLPVCGGTLSPLILYPLPACGGTPPARGENADCVWSMKYICKTLRREI